MRREVCRSNPGAVVRGAHGQVFPVERLDDLLLQARGLTYNFLQTEE
jgi:hypothetical protein